MVHSLDYILIFYYENIKVDETELKVEYFSFLFLEIAKIKKKH